MPLAIVQARSATQGTRQHKPQHPHTFWEVDKSPFLSSHFSFAESYPSLAFSRHTRPHAQQPPMHLFMLGCVHFLSVMGLR